MNKVKSLFMIILVTLGTFATSGSAIAQGVKTPTAGAEEILSSKPTLKKGDSTETKPGETKNVFEDIVTRPNVTIPDGVYSIISLPKDKFLKPQQDDLTNDDPQIIKSEIGETADAYQIKYYYKNLAVGTEVAIPFKVRTMPNMKPGTVFPITDKTYDGQGNILSNGGEVDLEYNAEMPILAVEETSDNVTENQVDSDDKLLADYSTSLTVSTNESEFIDPRDYVVAVNIPEPLKYNPDSEYAKGWTYDEATRTATAVDHPDENGKHNRVYWSLPVIVSKGSKVEVKYPVHGTISASDSLGQPFSKDDGGVTLHVKKDVVVPGDGNKDAYIKTDGTYGMYSDSAGLTAETKDANLWTQLYAVNPYGKNKPGSNVNFSATVKSIEDIPDDFVNVSGKYTDMPNETSKDTINGANSVYTIASVSASNISDELKAQISKNKLTVNYADGTSEIIDNIKFTSTFRAGTDFNKDEKAIKNIKLAFDQPVHVDQDHGWNLQLELNGQIDKDILQKIKESEYQAARLTNKMVVNYVSDDPNSQTSTDSSTVILGKQVPSVAADSLNFSADTMLSGNTIDAISKFTVKGSENLANKDLKNGKVVYLFDKPGVTLSDKNMANVKNLKNLKVINNFKNTGKTAIMGDITNGSITEDGTLDYSIPITSSKALDKGKVNADVFLVFDNDLSTYNLSGVEKSGYKIANKYFYTNPVSPPGEFDTYGLYDNTDFPDGMVLTGNNFTFEPSARYSVTKLVSKKGADNWVEDTGNIAKKAGEEYSYRLKIANYSLNDDFSKMDSVEVLPYVGDKMITNGVTDPTYHDRGSQFNMTLTGPVNEVPEGYTVLYTTDPVKEAQGLKANLDSNWLTADQVTDWSKVTMIRIKANDDTILKREQSVTVQFDVKTPADIDYADELMSGNTFASQAENQQGTLQSPVESDTAIVRTAGKDPVIPDETGTIRVEKADSEDSSKLLPGAEFKLTGPDGKVYTGTTDEDGSLTFNDLAFGDYELVETKAPAGYDLNDKVYKVTVDKDNARQTVVVKDTLTELKDGSIKVQKVDSSDTTKLLPGAEFKLTGPDGKVYTGTTDENGSFTFDNLAYGDYELVETKAPKGYDLNNKVYKVTVSKDDKSQTITVKDTLTVVEDETGTIRVQKVDSSDTTKLLPGAEFKLTGPDGKVYTGTTDKDGSFTFDNLAYGDYELVETKAPKGYDLNDKVYKVTVSKDDKSQTIVVKDTLADDPSDPGTDQPTPPGKDPSKPGTDKPATPGNNDNKPGNSNSKNTNKKHSKKNGLPQTGEDIRNASILSIVGVVLLAIIGYVIVRKKRITK